ncbi:hypothetical protein [Mesorhizobium sp. AA23]|uniref:hypothetical protein n=1 Tax=Mesorhizobium sp. AA23 TaxID=1854058 RepID=UPI0032AEB609
MPHMGIEYSANLDAKVEMSELCALVSRIILETGLFEPGAERVRAFRADAHAVADRLPENGFIDMNFRIGRGRSAEEKKRTGEAIIKGLSRAFYVDTLGLQVSDETSDAIYLRALEERGHPSPREADLRWIGAIVSRNGEVEETGLGAGVLDHPAKALCGSPTGCISTACKSRPDRWCCRAPSSGRSNAGMAIGSSRISGPLVRSASLSPDRPREFASCALPQRKRPGAKAARPRNEGHNLQRGTSPGAMGGKHRAMASIWSGCGIFSTN